MLKYVLGSRDCSPEQVLKALVSPLAPAADSSDPYSLVSLINGVDCSEITDTHPVYAITGLVARSDGHGSFGRWTTAEAKQACEIL